VRACPVVVMPVVGFRHRSRAAVARLNDDKDYAEETFKTMQFVPHYETGADLNARVRKAMTVTPQLRNFVIDYMKSAR
jgi:hypothetical protein